MQAIKVCFGQIARYRGAYILGMEQGIKRYVALQQRVVAADEYMGLAPCHPYIGRKTVYIVASVAEIRNTCFGCKARSGRHEVGSNAVGLYISRKRT